MKKTRKCPKCGGQAIFYVRGDDLFVTDIQEVTDVPTHETK